MIVIHIESGLGNQMLSYCEYLSLKHMNPDQDFYMETIVYEIPECNNTICQWNGYELERIFGIKEPKNIRSLFNDDEWNSIIQEIRDTEFWIHNWNYPVAFTEVLGRHGLNLENRRGDFDPNHNIITGVAPAKSLSDRFKDTYIGDFIKRTFHNLFYRSYLRRFDYKDKLFFETKCNVFTGQWLGFKYKDNDNYLIANEIKDRFVFPEHDSTRNINMESFLDSCNSVAVHARRGDMLGANGWCYKYGYFKRAVKYIRKHVENPVFVFFTDPHSIRWCKDNAPTFDLDYSRDTVIFVDWNSGTDSFRDMQLMSHCKHAIITNSSFGWWGAYLIRNSDKITISPSPEIDTTYHC